MSQLKLLAFGEPPCSALSLLCSITSPPGMDSALLPVIYILPLKSIPYFPKLSQVYKHDQVFPFWKKNVTLQHFIIIYLHAFSHQAKILKRNLNSLH